MKTESTGSFCERHRCSISIGVLLAVLLVLAFVCMWNRWWRYSDEADFQGEWQIHGSSAVVVIDDRFIKLTPQVCYRYVLDTRAKTTSFTFGTMKGRGHYRFSPDRTQLVIIDGTDGTTSWVSTLIDDIAWAFGEIEYFLQGKNHQEALEGKGVVVLERISTDTQALPREMPPANEEQDQAQDQAQAQDQDQARDQAPSEAFVSPQEALEVNDLSL